jgi:non-ribosomal peptide synthetase component E (peptide arylation enzyme)
MTLGKLHYLEVARSIQEAASKLNYQVLQHVDRSTMVSLPYGMTMQIRLYSLYPYVEPCLVLSNRSASFTRYLSMQKAYIFLELIISKLEDMRSLVDLLRKEGKTLNDFREASY